MKAPLQGAVLGLLTFALSLAGFIQLIDLYIANVAIPYISGELGVSNNQGTWVITSFAVGNAIMLPMTGWLTKRLGSVRLMVGSTLLFTFFSVLCGASFNYSMLVICRFFQGAVSGPLIPLSQSLIFQNYPESRRNFATGIFLTILVLSPVLGPVAGGWISENYHWPWIFYVNLPIGLLSATITWMILKDRETPIVKEPTDWMGLFLLCIAVSCLQILLDKGEQYDWFSSPFIIILSIISFICFGLLLIWELTTEHPLLELNLFKNRNFLIGTFVTSIVFAVVYGGVVITPLWLQVYMGYTATWAGLAVAPMGFCAILFGAFTGKIMSKVAAQYLLMVSFACFAGSYFFAAFFDTDVTVGRIAFSRFLFGTGLVFFFPPLVALSMKGVPNEKLSSASGLFYFFRGISQGGGISLLVYLWDRRAILHQLNLGEMVTPYVKATQEAFKTASSLGLSMQQQVALIDTISEQQAYMLAMNDINWLSAWLCVGLIFVSLIFRGNKSASPVTSHE